MSRIDPIVAFERPRRRMLEAQLLPRGITDARVLDAMLHVPRHMFVDAALASHAYQDSALPIGEGQTISQPYMVAKMSQLLELQGHERVLEIGTGCGYQTAVLSRLCRRVYSIERIASLSQRARRNLRAARHANVMLKCADGTLGWDEYAPFDALLAAAGGSEIPNAWVQQLRDGGVLIMPIGSAGAHELIRLRKRAGKLIEERFDTCSFVPLIAGAHI
ncbi:MAG: protein-L-isoaspartate(D-aspartate) O-methyltransferase [Mariprofundaceae bacterium]|nr:protein-L-isoaspartate(D-aspartate) O-methyltransferase [Mariprofundaceae bacterium]